jgi:hypothetical protein
MIHKRIITLEGDEEWITKTIQKSLKEGVNKGIFGGNRTITVETLDGGIINDGIPPKPEERFEK